MILVGRVDNHLLESGVLDGATHPKPAGPAFVNTAVARKQVMLNRSTGSLWFLPQAPKKLPARPIALSELAMLCSQTDLIRFDIAPP